MWRHREEDGPLQAKERGIRRNAPQTRWSRTSSLQNCEIINVYCEPPSLWYLFWLRKQTNVLREEAWAGFTAHMLSWLEKSCCKVHSLTRWPWVCWQFLELTCRVTLITYQHASPEGNASFEWGGWIVPKQDGPHDAAKADVYQANQDLEGLSGEPQAETCVSGGGICPLSLPHDSFVF